MSATATAIEIETEPSPGSAATPGPTFGTRALRPGARLDEFEIVRVLGEGGFGIVYLALDQQLLRYVAIKEFFPAALAARADDGAITVHSASDRDTFRLGMESFFNEGRLLARFDDPALVRVYRFWKANGTAYMAMQYYPGQTLKEARREMGAAPDEAWLRRFVERVLGALQALHGEGVYHRDIAPDNILLLPDGEPVILDFGSARRVIGDRTQSLTAFLKPNYSPVEQYVDDAAMRQGPYTDLYALGGTVNFMLTGAEPTPAVMRAVRDTQPLLAGRPTPPFPGIGEPFLAIVDWMLAVSPENRPRAVADVRAALAGELVPPAPTARLGVLISDPDQPDDASRATAKTELLRPEPSLPAGDTLPTVRLTRRMPLERAGSAAAASAAPGATDAAPARSMRVPPSTRNPRNAFAVVAAVVVAATLGWLGLRGPGPAPVGVAGTAPAASAVLAIEPIRDTAPGPLANVAPAREVPAAVGGEPDAVPGRLPPSVPATASASASAAATPSAREARRAAPAAAPPAVALAGKARAKAAAPAPAPALPAPDAPAEVERPAVQARLDPRAGDAAGPCPDMNFFARSACLSRSCPQPRWSSHAMCVGTLRQAEERARRGEQ